MRELLDRIPPAYQAFAVICLAVGLGFGAGSAAVQFSELPEQVAENTQAIKRLNEDMETMKDQIRIANCLEITERTGEDWRTCLP